MPLLVTLFPTPELLGANAGAWGTWGAREGLLQCTGVQATCVSERALHGHLRGQGVVCVPVRSAAAPLGAPPGKPWGTVHGTIWQVGRGTVQGPGTGTGLPGSAAGPNLGSSNPRSCPRVSGGISSGHPAPAANPALAVHQPRGPTCRKVCKISENALNECSPTVPLQLPNLWEKEDTFSLQSPETERLAVFEMLEARPPWVSPDKDLP